MRIGIDIDGVITDLERFILDYGTKFNTKYNLPNEIVVDEYEEQKKFNWTDEQEEKFWNEFFVYYATEYRARDFASEVINKLKEEGHEIYLITARNDEGLPESHMGRMREFVAKWLEDHNIYYDKLIYTEGSKVPYCVGNYVEIMIEDFPANIYDISSKIPVLCFHSQYNRHVEGKNITRVYSWYDIYNEINKRS